MGKTHWRNGSSTFILSAQVLKGNFQVSLLLGSHVITSVERLEDLRWHAVHHVPAPLHLGLLQPLQLAQQPRVVLPNTHTHTHYLIRMIWRLDMHSCPFKEGHVSLRSPVCLFPYEEHGLLEVVPAQVVPADHGPHLSPAPPTAEPPTLLPPGHPAAGIRTVNQVSEKEYKA